MEIKKFEEKDRLPDPANVCLCFMEQPGPEGSAGSEKFRKVPSRPHSRFDIAWSWPINASFSPGF
jgi:hypothetical protein